MKKRSPEYGLLIDYEYCTGCHSCEVACAQEYKHEPGVRGIKVFEVEQKLPDGGRRQTLLRWVNEDLQERFRGRIAVFDLQAAAVWCWANFLHDSAPPDRRPLHINFDETGIRYFQDARDGLLTESAREARRAPRSLTQSVPRGDTRAMMSLAAFICDDPEVQDHLPQVLLVSARLTPAP